MYNNLHNNFLKAVQSLGLKFPVRDLHRKTGFSTSVISVYLSSKQQVSENFAQKFCEEFGFNYEEMSKASPSTFTTTSKPKQPNENKDDGLSFHERVKLVRETNNLTQQQMADKLGLHRSQLGKLEQGEIGLKIKDIINLCTTFNISADWLLMGRDKMHFKPAAGKIRKFFNNLVTQITLSAPNVNYMKPIQESLQRMDESIKELGEEKE